MKRGFFSRLFGAREFEASRPWEVAQPVAQPQPMVGRPVVTRDPVMTRYVQLPLTAAIICGLFAALLPAAIAGGIIAVTGARGWWLASVPITYTVSALSLSGVAWYVLFIRGMTILEFLERLTGVDINKDGAIGKPAEPEVVTVEVIDRANHSIHRHDLPVKDRETLRQVAHAVLQLGCNLSKRGLAEHTNLSEEKALVLLAAMREKGFARFNTAGKPESGTALTKNGLDLFKRVL